MMRMFILLLLLLAMHMPAVAGILPIGPGEYSGLHAAAADVRPGDTILFRSGTHNGGAHVRGLQGTAEAWITITGEEGALIYGGTNGIQLSDPAYLRITHLAFDGQTGNGVNIDDGGDYETPARHLLIAFCEWRGINATGNNDMLKMSGVDSFTVRDCRFINGSPGGSMIDMVGCHYGHFERNHFENAGSNCIQAKGGTRYIRIERNIFQNGGQRAINIGGSTGLPYFRPPDADYEASDIIVFANIFTGATAPIAYVGAVHCQVVNNTIWLPEKWAVRILQESADARFQTCGNNSFVNNLIVLDHRAAAPTFNVGPNTAPESFLFSNNLWYNPDNAGWSGPNTPAPEIQAIIGSNPLLSAPAMLNGDFSLLPASPAIAAGSATLLPADDFLGHPFNDPPSIGAIEGNVPTTSVGRPSAAGMFDVSVYPQPARGQVWVRLQAAANAQVTLTVFDAQGRRIKTWKQTQGFSDERTRRLSLESLPDGLYILVAQSGRHSRLRPFLLLR
ncbi:MAG: right-handed parallel beta-helix repeat-containing protein [Bacteroidetes bacterium]|nr:right-handed parallel beta-helix repeat-containing protein [Bacteroidota bacterium]